MTTITLGDGQNNASKNGIDRPLDSLNFFLADVRDGLGPYLAIYLLSVQKWDELSIGLVMTVGGIAGIVAQTPAGALIDNSKHKKALIIFAAIAVTICSIALPWLTSFQAVALSQIITGAAGSIFQPALAAITLGLVGPKMFAKRNGRNEAFNHAGNAFAAALAGIFAWEFGPIAVFYLMAAMAVASILSMMAVPFNRVDHQLARGLHENASEVEDKVSGFRVLITCRPLLIFSLCVVLFHFANAAMLPLVGQKLALANPSLATTLMSVCILVAQLVMVPVALLVGAKADIWGRKPIFLVGLAVLALRGGLYVVSDNPYWLVAVQSLDGIGAGIFGALFPIIVNDLTKGTGHFNISQGAIVTALGIGASLSTAVAGSIVVGFGYSAAFLFLGAVAALSTIIYALYMPDTGSTARSP
jgi:MFS family permease